MPEASIAHLAILPGPWGPIHAAATDQGIVSIALFGSAEAFHADLARLLSSRKPQPATGRATEHLERLTAQFAAYFRGQLTAFDVPLDLRVGSGWDRLVLLGVAGISFGSVASYGEVAAAIGRFGAARAVGGAVGRNPLAILIPCHRVVAAGGRLGGYGGDWYGTREERLAIKRELLRREGVLLRDDPMADAAGADSTAESKPEPRPGQGPELQPATTPRARVRTARTG